jgi:vancomycin resistance protein YoaR
LLYNKLIAYAKGYFTGKSKKKYMFYGGVCWTSTMIFRLALISPQIFVEKRYNHNHRYWKYYSKYLFWDDAALYEMKKILKIKNISKKPYYFKVKRIGRKIYLVWIYPEKSNFYTWVQKKQIGHLKAEVKKIVFNQDGGVIYFQKWISKYFGYAN